MSSFTQHWVKTVHAHSFDYPKAALQISLPTKYSEMPTEITLYLDNDALTKALVKAINDTVAAHQPGASARAPYVVERHDQEDGSIQYEIWDRRPDTYRRLCTIAEEDVEFDVDVEDRGRAKRDADLICAALNRHSQ